MEARALQIFESLFPLRVLLVLALDIERGVHAAEMLCKEILPIKLAAFADSRIPTSGSTGVGAATLVGLSALTLFANPGVKIQMLRGDVTFPFVLGCEG